MRSIRLTALNTLVSFIRKMTFAIRAGKLTVKAWGRITALSACVWDMPRLRALSSWIGAMASMPLRKASAI